MWCTCELVTLLKCKIARDSAEDDGVTPFRMLHSCHISSRTRPPDWIEAICSLVEINIREVTDQINQSSFLGGLEYHICLVCSPYASSSME